MRVDPKDTESVVERLRELRAKARYPLMPDDADAFVKFRSALVDAWPTLDAELSRLRADNERLRALYETAVQNRNYYADERKKERARASQAETQRDAAIALLGRYRAETPLGHQPHMIAHEADKLLAAIRSSISGQTGGQNG